MVVPITPEISIAASHIGTMASLPGMVTGHETAAVSLNAPCAAIPAT